MVCPSVCSSRPCSWRVACAGPSGLPGGSLPSSRRDTSRRPRPRRTQPRRPACRHGPALPAVLAPPPGPASHATPPEGPPFPAAHAFPPAGPAAVCPSSRPLAGRAAPPGTGRRGARLPERDGQGNQPPRKGTLSAQPPGRNKGGA